MTRTEDQIKAEIAAAKELLEKSGRVIFGSSSSEYDESGIRCDFDLPYSTLPKLQAKKWAKTAQGYLSYTLLS